MNVLLKMTTTLSSVVSNLNSEEGIVYCKFPAEYYAFTICPVGHDCTQLLVVHEEIISHSYRNGKGQSVKCCCPALQDSTTKVIPHKMKSDKKKNVIYCRL